MDEICCTIPRCRCVMEEKDDERYSSSRSINLNNSSRRISPIPVGDEEKDDENHNEQVGTSISSSSIRSTNINILHSVLFVDFDIIIFNGLS